MNVREAIYGRRAVGEFSAEPACWIGFARGWQGTSAGKSVLKLPEAEFRLPPLSSDIPNPSRLRFPVSQQGLTGFRRIEELPVESRSRSKITTLVASPDRALQALAEPAAKEAMATPKAAKTGEPGRPKAATVSWYGSSLLIISTLLVATGWELFRLILAIIAMD